MVTLHEELQTAEATLRETNRQIVVLEQRLVDEDELTGAYEAFEPMWERMRPDERARLVHLLVQCVEHDGAGGAIAITYHPGGLAGRRAMEVTTDA